MRIAGRFVTWAIAAITLAACASAPAPAAPRPLTQVSASFGKTWDAVIDVFGERDMGIRTIDRSSGLIVPADYLFPSRDNATQYADCGRMLGAPIRPTVAHFNVIVRGDSSASTIRVRAFYDHSKPVGMSAEVARDAGNCTSSGLFESEIETAVAARAEGRPLKAAASGPCTRSDGADLSGEDMESTVYLQAQDGSCVPHHCRFRYGASRLTQGDAIQKCRDDAAASKPQKPL